MMQLDLRFKGNLSNNHKKIFEKIAKDKIEEFNIFIENISKDNIKYKEWFMTSVFSRNTLVSPLFHNYLIYYFLKELKKIDQIFDIIYLDNPVQEKLVINIVKALNFKFKIQMITKNNIYFYRAKQIIKNIIVVFTEVFKRIIQNLICSASRIFSSKNVYKSDLILIDTYVFPNYITNERYYNKLLEFAPKELNNKILFVPTLAYFKLSNLFYTYKKLRQSTKKYFLIKEDYINIFNILKISFFIIKKSFFNYNNTIINNVDYKPLIKNEVNDLALYIHPLFEGMLTYNFVKKIKINKLSVKLSINWFENNQKAKGWNLAFNNFYPKIKTK